MGKRLIIKTILCGFIIAIYNGVSQMISPLITNELAMNQMNLSVDSHLWLQLYIYCKNYVAIIFICFLILLFYKDIKILIDKLKENSNDEKEI